MLAEDFKIKYSPPDFNEQWIIYFSPHTLKHMFDDTDNKQRLSKVFGSLANNQHLIFRTIYGEIELQRKEGVVLSQWYKQEYQFLMPLFLTQDEKVELTAGLTSNHLLKRYEIKTLLLPHYSYAYARAITLKC